MKQEQNIQAQYIKEQYRFQDLVDIVHQLRDRETGCPWDSVQTYESMKNCVTNEAAEVVEAVEQKDILNLKEELGDLLLQVLLYSDVAAENGDFTLDDVIQEISKKMIRRHPHVFTQEDDSEEMAARLGIRRWDAIKLKEKEARLKEYETQFLQGKISKELYELQQQKMQKFQEKIGILYKNNG